MASSKWNLSEDRHFDPDPSTRKIAHELYESAADVPILPSATRNLRNDRTDARYLAVDAVGSRFEVDYRTALGRMDSAGATLTSTEAALFEWCEVAGTPEFREISRLVREQAPDQQSDGC